MRIEEFKNEVRAVKSRYHSREEQARRLFMEERAVSLRDDREREFSIRTDIATFFNASYASVCFCGSAQLGFSITKDTLFKPAESDLDAACVDINLFQQAWTDVIGTTRAFTDATVFGGRSIDSISRFKDQILRRGMILVDAMPRSDLTRSWARFEGELSRRHTEKFKRISVAIYMNEYAFCWKQDSVISHLIG